MSNEFIASNEFLKTYEWRKIRQEVIIESKQRCSCCGVKPDLNNEIYLCVDHIFPRKTHPELALVKSNLQVLCNVCNHGKGNWDTTDWREDAQFKITEEWLRTFTNNFAGLKKAQLAVLNLHWPVKKGWVEELIGMEITVRQKELFESNLNNKAKYSGEQKRLKIKVSIA